MWAVPWLWWNSSFLSLSLFPPLTPTASQRWSHSSFGSEEQLAYSVWLFEKKGKGSENKPAF